MRWLFCPAWSVALTAVIIFIAKGWISSFEPKPYRVCYAAERWKAIPWPFSCCFYWSVILKALRHGTRKALRRGKPNCVESVQEPNKELAGLCILEHKIFSFGNMILRDRRSTSYDLASLFRGRRSTLDRRSGKIAKPIGTRPSALHSTFHFWRKSRRIVSFLTLSNSSFVFKLADRQIDRSIDR